MQLLSLSKDTIKHVLSFLGGGQIYKLYYISKSIRAHVKKARLTHKAQAEAIGIINRVDSDITFDSPMAIGFTRLWKSLSGEEQKQFRKWIRKDMDYALTYLPIRCNHLGVSRAGIWNEDWGKPSVFPLD
jgi:hypothetical protein